MKKYIFVAILIALFVVTPVLAQQTSVADQIAGIRAQIATLTAQLNQLLDQQPKPTVACYEFRRDFRETEQSEDVARVKEILKSENVTSVKALQEKYADEILKPIGLKTGTGYVGAATRAKINQLYYSRCKPFITPTELGNAKVGENYSKDLTPHGFYPSTWQISSGALPEGLLLDWVTARCPITAGTICGIKVGEIRGIPTNAGVYSFTIQATDGAKTATQKYTLVVKDKNGNTGAPVISGISGPTSLKVGEKGTWKIKASDSNNGTLDYSVIWGDEIASAVATGREASPLFRQTATFEHTYNTAGVYSPVFTVRDDQGNQVGSSLSVKVGNTSSPITVLSPNIGENWISNSTQVIKWSGSNKKVDLYLDDFCSPWNDTCTTPPGISYVLDENISGKSYNWIVATDINNAEIPDGHYLVRICEAGTATCDSSDHPLIITHTPIPGV